jgi:hypothetical protein
MSTTEESEGYGEIPDTSLIDNTTVGHSSDLETFTTFEEILRQERAWKPIETSDHSFSSRTDSTAEVLWETQALFMRTRSQVDGYTEDAGNKAKEYAKSARSTMDVCIEDFFSDEQKQARADLAVKVASALRAGLGTCHDAVDNLLIRMFDQPLREVEVRPLDTMTVNETMTDMTIDSEITRRETPHLKRTAQSTRDDENVVFLIPVEKESSRGGSKAQAWRADSAARDEPETDTSAVDEAVDILDSSGSASLGLETNETEDDDDESVLRFKESLYKQYGAEDKAQTLLSSLLDDEVPKSEEKPTDTRGTEFGEITAFQQRIPRSEIERDDPIDISTLEVETVDTETTSNLSTLEVETVDTETTCNLSYQQDAEFIDLSDRSDRTDRCFVSAYEDPTVPSGNIIANDNKSGFGISNAALAKAVIDPYTGTETIDCSEIDDRDAQDTFQYRDEVAIDLTMY